MANEKRLIDANALIAEITKAQDSLITNNDSLWHINQKYYKGLAWAHRLALDAPTVDAVEVVHGQRLYNAHEVAEIIADILGDPCACNFNSIDEWLPFKCELQAACPNPVGVACWEQYLKYRDAKMDGERKDNEKMADK